LEVDYPTTSALLHRRLNRSHQERIGQPHPDQRLTDDTRCEGVKVELYVGILGHG
jgi:hypothetical protein